MATAPRVRVELKYNGRDITRDIAPFMQSFSYTDHAGSQADEIALELEDLGKLWGGQWQPLEGDSITASIVCFDWEYADQQLALHCGTFAIDSLTFTGPPDGLTIRGISAPLTTGLRRQRKHKAWENLRLQQIAQDIAANAGLQLIYDATVDPMYVRRDQHFQSDLAMLQDFCTRCALRLKVDDQRIIIFDEAVYEQHAPAVTLAHLYSNYISYQFPKNYADSYRACTVNYHDPGKKTTFTATFAPAEPPPGEVLEVNERVENQAEALLLAQARLREKNRLVETAHFELPYNPHVVGAATAQLIGWPPRCDGRYLVDSVTHSVSSGGSTSSVELHKALVGY
jgi:hypothetical protein